MNQVAPNILSHILLLKVGSDLGSIAVTTNPYALAPLLKKKPVVTGLLGKLEMRRLELLTPYMRSKCSTN